VQFKKNNSDCGIFMLIFTEYLLTKITGQCNKSINLSSINETQVAEKKLELINVFSERWKKVCSGVRHTVSTMTQTAGNDTKTVNCKNTKPLLLGKKSNPEEINKKVLLIGDSHAKNLSHPLQKELGETTKLTVISRPGAPFKYVIHDLEELTTDYTEKD